MMDDAWHRVCERLRDPDTWRLVETLAQALLQHWTLDAEQIAPLDLAGGHPEQCYHVAQ